MTLGSEARTRMTPAHEIGFLFLSGEHQMLHLAPVAAELQKRGVRVRVFAGDSEAAPLRALLTRLGSDLAIETLAAPRWSSWLTRLVPSWAALKLPRMIVARRTLAEPAILVVAERTSTILKRLPGPKARLVHIPHGAGDRAKGFEPRIRLFDHVIVSGAKDRDRMIAAGVVAPQDCSVSGCIKVAAIRSRLADTAGPRLFANERPIVLYNPHFAPDLSSWQKFSNRLIEAFAAQDVYNLIIAPHVRLMENARPAEKRKFEARGVEGKIIVDAGSSRCCDMTYTNAADIYVGDVSSQVYEFISRPRPCVFLDAGKRAWQHDPCFAFWHFGDVVTDPDTVLAAVERAAGRHPSYRAVQAKAAGAALGDPERDAVSEAADIIMSLAAAAVGGRSLRSARRVEGGAPALGLSR